MGGPGLTRTGAYPDGFGRRVYTLYKMTKAMNGFLANSLYCGEATLSGSQQSAIDLQDQSRLCPIVPQEDETGILVGLKFNVVRPFVFPSCLR